MGGWREKNYWKVVSVAYFVDSGIMIYAMHKYHIGSVWQAQFATWLLALAGVLAIAERLYWKKIPEGDRRERIARLKDVYYDKTICIIYVIVWLILLFGAYRTKRVGKSRYNRWNSNDCSGFILSSTRYTMDKKSW